MVPMLCYQNLQKHQYTTLRGESRHVHSHLDVVPLAINKVLQSLAAQQLHQLALLLRLHACEGHAVQDDSMNQCLIWLLQQIGKCRSCHAALNCALQA